MSKSIPKKKKLGYALFIKQNDQDKSYIRVGGIFNTSGEASTYREREYPNTAKWSIQSIRVGV